MTLLGAGMGGLLIVRFGILPILLRTGGAFSQRIGRAILVAAPVMMKSLTVIGTVAMFMVGGGILTHGIAPVHHWIADVSAPLAAVPVIGGLLAALAPSVLDAVFGVIAGGVVLLLVTAVQRVLKIFKKN